MEIEEEIEEIEYGELVVIDEGLSTYPYIPN